jgi:hypothetical protein
LDARQEQRAAILARKARLLRANDRQVIPTVAQLRQVLPPKPALHYIPRPVAPVAAGQVVTVNHGASGIGDALLGLCAALGLQRETQCQLVYRCGAGAIPWVELFAGPVRVEAHDADTLGGTTRDVPLHSNPAHVQCNQGYGAEVSQRAPIARVDRYARNLGAFEPALPELTDREQLTQLGAEYRGAVILAPSRCDESRSWPWMHWRALSEVLVNEGLRVVLVDDQAERLKGLSGEQLVAAKPERVVAAMLNARTVVSIDSGLAHVAGCAGVPCVVLAAVTSARQIYGHYPSCIWVHGQLPCGGCWWQHPHDARHCHPRCAAIATITPVQVLAAILAAERLPALICDTDPGFNGFRADRRSTFRPFVRKILDTRSPLVVETGCQRADPDPGTGESTRLLGLVCGAARGRLVSIDNDQAHVATARRATRRLPVHVVHADAPSWLASYQGPAIDALYLDSADTWCPDFASVCLAEAKAAVPHVAGDGVILIDDTPARGDGWQGKGELAVPWLVSQGWRVASSGYQVFLERER